MRNPFDVGYTASELTDIIPEVPNMYGRIYNSGIFKRSATRTTTFRLDEDQQNLGLLSFTERGGPAQKNRRGKRSQRLFEIPYISVQDTITPDDIQDVLKLGTDAVLETLDSKYEEISQQMVNKYNITFEYHEAMAAQGVLLDANGDEMLNYFTEYGITRKAVNFVLGTDTTDIKAKCAEVRRYMQDNLLGERMSGVHCFAGRDWFDDFVSHPKVERAWDNFQGRSDNLANTPENFEFGGITFEEFYEVADVLNEDGTTTSRLFLPADEALFVPKGTQFTFMTKMGPPYSLQGVNQSKSGLTVSPHVLPHGEGIELKFQASPISICTRPALSVRGQ